MHEAVIVSSARAAIGTVYRGSLVDVDALELGTRAVAEAVRRAGVDPAVVDDVVLDVPGPSAPTEIPRT